MCHEEDFTELREGDLGARLGQALVGGTYLLIHAKDVDQHAVMIEEDARSIDVSYSYCRSCTQFICYAPPLSSSHHGLLEDRRLELLTDRCRYSSPTLILKVEDTIHFVIFAALQSLRGVLCLSFCYQPEQTESNIVQ